MPGIHFDSWTHTPLAVRSNMVQMFIKEGHEQFLDDPLYQMVRHENGQSVLAVHVHGAEIGESGKFMVEAGSEVRVIAYVRYAESLEYVCSLDGERHSVRPDHAFVVMLIQMPDDGQQVLLNLSIPEGLELNIEFEVYGIVGEVVPKMDTKIRQGPPVA